MRPDVDTDTGARLDRYEQRTATPLTMLALVFIGVYAVPILWPEGPDALLTVCAALNLTIWVLFAADLLARFMLAPERVRFLLTHPLDVVTVVLPVLRPLRVLRVFTVGQALFTRGARLSLLRAAEAVLVAVAVLMLISALAVLDAERTAPGANITSFSDALWWSATTVTTVGYGDQFPVTGLGRIVGVTLMFVGISLLGIITASVAAWFLTRTKEVVDEGSVATGDRLARLEQQLTEVRDLLRAQADRQPPSSQDHS